jgi:hypothetical protein
LTFWQMHSQELIKGQRNSSRPVTMQQTAHSVSFSGPSPNKKV